MSILHNISQANINWMLIYVGTLNESGTKTYLGMRSALFDGTDTGFGRFDFSATQLWSGSGVDGDIIRGVGEADATSRFFVVNEGLYDIQDFGNYLTGYALKLKLWSDIEMKHVTQLFTNVMNGESDTDSDQKAIMNGVAHIRANLGYHIIWFSKQHPSLMPSFINPEFAGKARLR